MNTFLNKKKKSPRTKSSPAPKKTRKASAEAMSLQARTPLQRMRRIHALLQDNKYPNTNFLRGKLGCCASTVGRDIQFMRDTLHLPVEYDARRYGYYYTEEVKQFPTVKLTSAERIALCVARQLMEAHRGSPFEPHLRSAFEKITHAMQDETTVHWDQLAAAFSIRTNGREAKMDLESLSWLSTAALECQEVEFAYRKLGAKGPERRRVHPMHLTSLEGTWYLLAYDPCREGYRTFALPRLSELKETGEKFVRREDFDARKLLENSIGIYKGAKPERVRLRARGIAAQLISERSWHSSQKVKPVPGTDGEEVEVTMKVAITPELEQWLLGRGVGLRVLEPESLRVRMREVLGAMAAEYGA